MLVTFSRFMAMLRGFQRPTVFPAAAWRALAAGSKTVDGRLAGGDGGGGGGNAPPRTDWQTTGEWIHWDQNPWLEPDFVRIQAVLAISEHTASSGGFHCVPGFCSQFRGWAAANEAAHQEDGSLVAVPAEDSMRPHLQRISMRAGSACLWDSRTPHGNAPAILMRRN